ncbi:MAG: T9SS type A sorting domain-containing protein [Flavobacteriales bacterium]|jgi:hypothetical protein|nr:T9SS type A sorting domain-containing protein [Flavobacteriales bacterium]
MKTKMTLIILFCTTMIYGQLVPNNLLLHLPFSGNADDASPHQRDGVVYGATLTDDRFGRPNNAYLFDGVDDYIFIGSDNYSVIDKLSMSVWIKTSSPSYQWIAGKYIWQEDAGYHLVTDDSKLIIAGRDGNSVPININSYTNVTDNTWKHIVATIDGSVWKIWIDGVLTRTYDSQHNNSDYRSTANLEIGRYFATSTQYFDGVIDDFRMYDRALTEQEVEILYNESPQYVGVSNDKAIESVAIYPNPTNGEVNIEVLDDQQQFTAYDIYDATGMLVLSKKIDNPFMTLSSDEIGSAGIYYIRFLPADRENQLIKKLIIH